MCCPSKPTTLKEKIPESRIFELHLNLRNLSKEEIAAYLTYSDEELERIYQEYNFNEDTKPAG